jgi:hypothetical protein
MRSRKIRFTWISGLMIIASVVIPSCSTVHLQTSRTTPPQPDAAGIVWYQAVQKNRVRVDRYGDSDRLEAFGESCLIALWPEELGQSPRLVIRETVRIHRTRYRYAVAIEAVYRTGETDQEIRTLLTTEAGRGIDSFPHLYRLIDQVLTAVITEIRNAKEPL